MRCILICSVILFDLAQKHKLLLSNGLIMQLPPVTVSPEITKQWDNFVSSHELPAQLIEQQLAIQIFWQQSPFVMRLCHAHPEWLESLLNSHTQTSTQQLFVETNRLADEANSEEEFKVLLRHFRQRVHLDICWCDLVAQQDIFLLLNELSVLADDCVQLAANWLTKKLVDKYGEPCDANGKAVHLVIVAMGKLGGNELNFSSDIDVMFCYSDTGQTNGQLSISNQEFFTQLVQSIIRVLSEITEDSFVYRVDCRLRPFGDSGPLVVNFNHIEDYLYTHGREWERYAYIKSRVIYGSNEDKCYFDQMVAGFVYRKYIDFGVINTLREMKALIARQVLSKGNVGNIKLGIGGIREIEFIVQFFQLVHGGYNSAMQTRHIVKGFEQIERAGYLLAEEVSVLYEAYGYLRRVENRIQMYEDQQTHVLPADQVRQQLLAQSMGYESAQAFLSDINAHRDAVNQIFANIQSDVDQDYAEDSYAILWQKLSSLDADEVFDIAAYDQINNDLFNDFDYVVERLKKLVAGSTYKHQDAEGRMRLNKFMPCFLRQLKQISSPRLAVDRLYLLLQNILRRSVYLVLLYENQDVLKQLIAVTCASPWIARHITSYPLLLDELMLRSEQDYFLAKENIAEQFADEVLSHEQLDYEAVLDRVRMFKHARELRISCADVLDKIAIMKVSDQLSWTAETVIAGCVDYLEKHFDPLMQGNIAVIAFGKLGGIELSYGSDLDLVYISQNENESGYGTDNNVPYTVKTTRFVQRLTQMLTLQTVSGKLYDVDTRLRPDGESGVMVTQMSAMQNYYLTRAWMWELQALVRARCVAGSSSLCQQFDNMRQQILCQPRDERQLAEQVVNMRARMLETKASKSNSVFHLKNDRGGITDIEFMVQYSVLAHAHKDIALCEYSDNVRLLERLAGGNFISRSMATEITDIYCRFRNKMHRIALQADKPEVDVAEFQAERKVVKAYWNKLLGE